MSLRRSTPLAFSPRGLSDTLDGTTVFSGAMAALRNLIPDPSTKNLWQCRPAATEAVNLIFGVQRPYSSGFSTGFQLGDTGDIPAPVGVISCMLIVGDLLFGMVNAGPISPDTGNDRDYPFAFDLRNNVFLDLGTSVTTAKRPLSQPVTGAWTPPIMDIVGSKVLVAHPGFDGTGGGWFGWFDIANLAAVTWNTGDLTGTAITFGALNTPPTSVANFNGRAYWMVNPKVTPSGVQGPATIFSDVLAPFTLTTATQVITYEDTTPLTALGKLGLSTQLGGLVQALIVFKGVSNMYQVTGDQATNNLSRNSLNVATGTFAPLSVAQTPKGLMFIAPDGLRLIDFGAKVSDPIGTDGMGKTLPFIYAFTPSRISAAANGTIYRVSVDDGSRTGTPKVEYWLDYSREGIWSGPHTFPARVIKPYQNTFIMAPWNADAALWRSDYIQSSTSSFTENGVPLQFSWATAMLPDTDQMCENAMIETTVYMSLAAGANYVVQALDQSGGVLKSANIIGGGQQAIWGSFVWGQALWGGASAALAPKRVDWPSPVVFRRLMMNVMGPSSQQFRIGRLHMRYEQLGYLQQVA